MSKICLEVPVLNIKIKVFKEGEIQLLEMYCGKSFALQIVMLVIKKTFFIISEYSEN